MLNYGTFVYGGRDVDPFWRTSSRKPEWPKTSCEWKQSQNVGLCFVLLNDRDTHGDIIDFPYTTWTGHHEWTSTLAVNTNRPI